MRVAKKHDVRLNEILDAAQQLFVTKGYESTTVNDILEVVGIGKGTFYHYFKSKEDVMNAVIDRIVMVMTVKAKAIADAKELGALQKISQIIFTLNISEGDNGQIISELHKPSNAQMHQKSIVETINAVSPILAEVVSQGIDEGVFRTDFPQETVEFLLAANQFIFDSGIFKWTPEEMFSRVRAFIKIMELSLGAKVGSFDFILKILEQVGLK